MNHNKENVPRYEYTYQTKIYWICKMGEIKDLNIKSRRYYYFDDIIDISKFERNLKKIDKKSHKDFDIYNIGLHYDLKV